MCVLARALYIACVRWALETCFHVLGCTFSLLIAPQSARGHASLGARTPTHAFRLRVCARSVPQAAQAGQLAACRALLAAGADALRRCTVPATGEAFGAAGEGCRTPAGPRCGPLSETLVAIAHLSCKPLAVHALGRAAALFAACHHA